MVYNNRTKYRLAKELLEKCIGPGGVSAAADRYMGQYWIRDLGYAIAEILHRIKRSDIVKRHLQSTMVEQRPNGQIPILVLEDEAAWVAGKEAESHKKGRTSFMLGRYREGNLWNLTPGTRDSEVLFIKAMYEYMLATNDTEFVDSNKHHIDAALTYIETQLVRDGLIIGCDWRDTLKKELGQTTLLTNNCLLYHVYKNLLKDEQKAAALRERILETFVQDGVFIDYPGNDRFDPLGGSMAVLYGIAEPHMYPGLVRSIKSVDTPYGVTIKCRHNPSGKLGEAEVINRTNGVVVWPFVNGYVVKMLHQMREYELAREQHAKSFKYPGFPEWIDPGTGICWGADGQLWSAAMFLIEAFTIVSQP